MATSFILGRAGMGKTRRCLLEIGEALRAAPEGPPLYLLVPEQATFHVERALLSLPGVSASFRAQVVSFRRLAYRAMNERGLAALDPVGGLERMLVLRSILERHRQRLARYGVLARRPALASELARTFTELARRGQSPQSLRSAQERLPAGSQLAEKLGDLALLWEEYQAGLAERALDPDRTLDRLVQLLQQGDWAAGARFWVDGFSGFSPQELAVLAALAGRADELRVSLCLDPTKLNELPADYRQLDPTRLFYPTEATYFQLSGLPRSGQDLHLGADVPPRQAAAPALARLEHALAEGATETFGADVGIRVHAFANPREEIVAVAAEIARLVHSEGYRYRDVAVVTRGMDEYASLVRLVLEEAGIPHFLDQRVPLRGHPLAALLTSALVLAGGMARGALRDLIKTGLTGLSDAATDALDNHFLAEGVDGFNYADKPWPTVGQALLADLVALGRSLHAAASISARDFCTALFNFLCRRQVRETLESWSARAEAEGRSSQSHAHRQAWEGVLALLDPMVSALGDERLTASEWSELFSLGLSDLQCALVPPSLDQVLVGSIERSRHPELRAVFFVGTLEGTLPKSPGPTGLFTDAERTLLSQMDCDVGPHASRLLAEEDYLAYIAFTRASERLVLTYPTHDAAGRDTVRSRWIDWILARVPDALQPLEQNALDLFPRQRLGRALLSLREAEEPETCPALPRLVGLLLHPDTRALTQRAIGCLWHHDDAVLPATLLSELGLADTELAVTALEDYGKCPFLHHAQRRLRLQERRTFEVDALELGRLSHALLEQYGRRVVERSGDWSSLTDEELGPGLLAALEEAAKVSGAGALWLDSARHRFMLTTHARRLARVLEFFRQESKATRFRTQAVEMTFSGGGSLSLRGKIDRLDACPAIDGQLLRVVDYKTGGVRFHAELAKRGVSLQLPVYALAARTTPGGRLCGAFFMSLSPARQKPTTPRGGPLAPAPDFKFRGFFDLATADRLAPGLGPQEASPFVQLSFNKDGTPSRWSEGLFPKEMEGMLAEVEATMAAMTREMARGCIAPVPVNLNPNDDARPKRHCTWCTYPSVCRYDRFDPARGEEDDEQEGKGP